MSDKGLFKIKGHSLNKGPLSYNIDSLVYTSLKLSRFVESLNAPNLDCNPDGLNPHPLVDWNLIGSRLEVS